MATTTTTPSSAYVTTSTPQQQQQQQAQRPQQRQQQAQQPQQQRQQPQQRGKKQQQPAQPTEEEKKATEAKEAEEKKKADSKISTGGIAGLVVLGIATLGLLIGVIVLSIDQDEEDEDDTPRELCSFETPDDLAPLHVSTGLYNFTDQTVLWEFGAASGWLADPEETGLVSGSIAPNQMVVVTSGTEPDADAPFINIDIISNDGLSGVTFRMERVGPQVEDEPPSALETTCERYVPNTALLQMLTTNVLCSNATLVKGARNGLSVHEPYEV